MRIHIQGLFLALFLIVMNQIAYGVIAYPRPVEIIQSDGSKIKIILKGDEHVKWAQTVDGYSIMRNSKGIFEYAMLDSKNDIIPSGIKARNQKERGSSEVEFLSKSLKGISFSKSQVGMMKSISRMYEKNSQKSFPTTGSRKLVCILIGFTDKAFTKTKLDFENLYNQVGYTVDGATGSVSDFYKENSYNQLNLSVTVAGPYTAANNMAYYGANDAFGDDVKPEALVTEAVNLANSSVNYADFDNDLDGTVDGVYIIYAGYGEEAGGSEDAIWAHAWSIPSLTLDGKTISKYSCSAELRDNVGSGITRIGVICHEFGHVMGAADFYDTDYADNGEYDGTGNWDLMANGSWNNDGATPAHHNPYTKIFKYGWATATTLVSGVNITLNNAEQNSNSFYRVNTATANEFFLIENRQQHKFDINIPGHGMIIYHVDGNFISTAGNGINTGNHQGMYPVCADATDNPPNDYGLINENGCPFPGMGNKTSFTDATTPNSKSWAAANTLKPITAITENVSNKTVSFTFMGGLTCVAPTIQATIFKSSALADNSMTVGWNRGNGNSVLVIARKGSAVNDAPMNGITYTANAAFGGGSQIGTGNYVVYNGTGTSVNLTALTSGTIYHYAIYEYNSTTVCYLSPALVGNATTTGTAPINYCNASTVSCDEYISNVSFGTINNSSSCTLGGYVDYSSIITNMAKGSTLTMSVTNGIPYESDQCGIWVDWNGNGNFLDDQAITVTGTPGRGPYSATINCPTSASLGLKRVRIRIHYSDEASAPCGRSEYGEVEDYSVNVVAACTPPTPPTIGTIIQPTCSVATGSVVLSGLPATGVWTLTRMPGGTTLTGTGASVTITGLFAGTYTYLVTNASGCVSGASGNVVINTQPAVPVVPFIGTITQPTCSVATGSVVLSGLPASGTWTLTRTPGGIITNGTGTTTTLTGLATGTYTFKVTNAQGCTSGTSGNVVINVQPTIPTTPLVGTITQPSCSNATGSVVLNSLPAVGTWTLTRTPGGIVTTGTGSSRTITGLVAGTYTYKVANSSGCASTSSGNIVIIASPLTPPAPIVGTITQPTCSVNTGSVVINGLPAVGTWTLTRTPGGIVTSGTGVSTTITGLSVGTYTYMITNGSGCSSLPSASIIINAAPVVTPPIVGAITQPTCSVATGSVVLSGLPASGTWTLTRTPGGIITNGTGATTTLTGLATGTYTFKVTNALGCASGASGNVVINVQPALPNAPTIGTITQPTCSVPTGGVVISGLPATGTWTLTRTPGGIITTGTGISTTISGLAVGTFTFKVANASGCSSVSSGNVVIIANPSTPSTPIVGTITQPTCSVATGSVVISGLPATGTWSLTRTPGGIVTTGTGISTTITGLVTGTYTYKVTNTSGCTSASSGNVVIIANSSTPPTPTVGTITQPTCLLSTGGVVIGGLPATGAWTLTRSPGGITTMGTGTNSTITGLSVGTYTFKVTNASGCISLPSANVIINAAPVLTPPIVGTITQTTVAISTGSVELKGLPATGTWVLTRTPGGITTNGTGIITTISGLTVGTYTYTVTNSGCTSASSANIVINSQPTDIDVDNSQVKNSLSQNYPNPFDQTTTIDFKLVKPSKVSLTVYNALGQVVDVIVDEYLSVGSYSIQWTPKGIASGIYFYQLKSNEIKETKSLIKK